MHKKLAAKTQYLNPTLPVDTHAFAKALSIEGEGDEKHHKRGIIYTVFNVSGGAGYDTNLASKVVQDILHNSYFQSENISPIQSLEKAISDVRNKIIHLTNESIHADDTPAEFSIIAGVLWGNVMYVVQYGNAQSYLVREGEIKPINTISEGTFSAASGIVKDGDVVIFCSQEFGKKYPPNKLLSMSIGEQELLADEACVLVKFNVDTTASVSDPSDLGLPELPRKKETPKFISKTFSALSKIKLPKREPKAKPVESIGSIGNTVSSPRIKLRTGKEFSLKTLTKPGVMITLIILALAISIFVTSKNKSKDSVATQTPAAEQVPTPVVEGAAKVAEEQDEQVFYDIKIADAEATPDDLAVFNNTIVATDSTSGKIYISDQTTAKFEPETTTFSGIKNLINIGGKLGFTDSEGYKVYDIAQAKATESYKQSGLGLTSAYLNYVYSISGDKLNRYSKSDNTLTESLWGQSASFSGAKSFTVAYSVYVITKDGKLESFTSGTKDTFATSGDKAGLSNPSKVFADIDLKYIYVADNGNGRVVAFDDKGAFVKEYKPKKEGAWSDIKAIGVTPDEKTLFVLNGSRVYKLAI